MARRARRPPAPPEHAQLDAEGLDRGVSFIGLLWASETSIIGSGWLFGALGAAVIAGPVGDPRLGPRVGHHPRAGARARRAGRAVPGQRRDQPLPALRVRQLRRRDVRLGLLPAGGQRRADRGPGRHPVPLDRPLGPELLHVSTDAGLAGGHPARLGLPRRGDPDAPVRGHQPRRDPLRSPGSTTRSPRGRWRSP